MTTVEERIQQVFEDWRKKHFMSLHRIEKDVLQILAEYKIIKKEIEGKLKELQPK